MSPFTSKNTSCLDYWWYTNDINGCLMSISLSASIAHLYTNVSPIEVFVYSVSKLFSALTRIRQTYDFRNWTFTVPAASRGPRPRPATAVGRGCARPLVAQAFRPANGREGSSPPRP